MTGTLSIITKFELKSTKMWSKNLSKLSAFLVLLVLLVNIAHCQTTVDSLAIDEQLQDLNGNAVIAENFNLDNANVIETTTTANEEGSGDLITTTTDANIIKTTTPNEEGSGELVTSTTTESNSEDVNNTETSTNAAASTEPATESSTDQIECICDCIVNDNQVTLGCSTQAPRETTTESSENPETTTTTTNSETTTTITSSPNDETTLPNNETTQTTVVQEESTIPSNEEVVSTTEEPSITTIAPPPVCSNPGVQAHELDCKQYYHCSLENSLDGNFHLLTKSCPGKQAFNSELNRCSRDISSCSLPVQCLVKGSLADPDNNSSYYLCEPRLIGLGFRIFHIDCAANEIFYPALGKCFVDFNNLPTQGYPLYNWNQLKDIDIVKSELKLLKAEDKLKLKQEKDRKKAEERLQKQFEKEAKKKAKEEEKANKLRAKQEAATFVCLQEGNYASGISENIYYACINKKGKLKAQPMQCTFGATFNPETGTCINSLINVNNSVSEDEDDISDD